MAECLKVCCCKNSALDKTDKRTVRLFSDLRILNGNLSNTSVTLQHNGA